LSLHAEISNMDLTITFCLLELACRILKLDDVGGRHSGLWL